nr:MAG TPA: hypothetical protein [Caudoviricetes sp.]
MIIKRFSETKFSHHTFLLIQLAQNTVCLYS